MVPTALIKQGPARALSANWLGARKGPERLYLGNLPLMWFWIVIAVVVILAWGVGVVMGYLAGTGG